MQTLPQTPSSSDALVGEGRATSFSWPAGDDPHGWLEQSEAPEVTQWVAAQNERTLRAYARGEVFETLVQRLVDDALSPDQLVVPTRHGDRAYDFRQDEAHPLGIWRRCGWADWLAGTPQWQTLLDLGKLSEDEDVDWSWRGDALCYPDNDRALLSLSPGGGDTTVLREFDLVELAFVEDGFNVDIDGKHGGRWIDRDTVYFEWDASEGDTNHPSVTQAGLPREVRRWSRGTALEDAPVVFSCLPGDVGASVSFNIESQRHLATRGINFDEGTTSWLDGDTWRQYEVPLDAMVFIWKGWLVIAPSSDWTVGGTTHRGSCLIAIREDAFLEGERNFLPLFTATDKTSLTGFETGKEWAAINYSDDLLTRTRFWKPPVVGLEIAPIENTSNGTISTGDASDDSSGNATRIACALASINPAIHAFRELPVDGYSETSVQFIDSTRDDALFLISEHYLEPPTLWLGDAGATDLAERRRIQQLPASFDASGMTVIRASATAPDGTAIPYWVIGKRELIEAGTRHTAPCLLYGYGGFDLALNPSYVDEAGIAWLEQGGIHVVANIRGGGEYGQEWHRAALREKRPVSFDDFVAVAKALVEHGFTTSPQLAIQGGSNGGLLVAACMIRNPDLFGAVVCEAPVLDMQGVRTLLAGTAGVEEYGDPDKPEDARFLCAYSPYHRVAADVDYPPILLTTSAGDDRVHPAHARKMAAKMQAMGHAQVWFHEEAQGGHTGTPDPRDDAYRVALVYRFLWDTIGR